MDAFSAQKLYSNYNFSCRDLILSPWKMLNFTWRELLHLLLLAYLTEMNLGYSDCIFTDWRHTDVLCVTLSPMSVFKGCVAITSLLHWLCPVCVNPIISLISSCVLVYQVFIIILLIRKKLKNWTINSHVFMYTLVSVHNTAYTYNTQLVSTLIFMFSSSLSPFPPSVICCVWRSYTMSY